MKRVFAAMLAVICLPAHAYIITIDADEYAAWTDVSNAVPGVRLSTFTNARTGEPTFDPVYAMHLDLSNPESDYDGVIGSGVFAHAPDLPRAAPDFTGAVGALYDAPSDYLVFRADFAQATDMVEIRTLFQSNWYDPAVLWAFDANGTFLNGCVLYAQSLQPRTGSGWLGPATTEPAGLPCGELLWQGDCRVISQYPYCDSVYTMRIDRSVSDVSYILFGGNYFTDNTPVVFDRISYRVSTVPEPGALALMALGAIGAVMGRKRRLAS